MPARTPAVQARPLVADGALHEAPVFERAALAAGFAIDGPALILEQGATTFVDAGLARAHERAWRSHPHPRHAARTRTPSARQVDPILLEVFNNRFMGVAEEMGLALQTTASSVNIKERLDFSCAVFDETGGLVANAPHIPVHLGSMSDSVREILRAARRRRIRPGDIYMLNAPHAGGTHLPDITVIAPVILDGDDAPAFFTAARGHHADIGGITPGSMPPDSRTHRRRRRADRELPAGGATAVCAKRKRAPCSPPAPHPARDIDRNIADLKAQIAACVRGAEELKRLVAHYGREGVAAYMRHVQDNAEEQIRRVIDTLEPGAVRRADGQWRDRPRRRHAGSRRAHACASISPARAPQSDGNFNAPLAITRAAMLYVFRTLVDDDIPLNEGCLKPIEIIVPEGSLLNPKRGAAVVAGNVETSQVVVDALYGALGALAASQGTMNNFTFGDEQRQYYETICGGSGAGPDFDGASRRADAHDQFPPHRSRSAGNALPRPGRAIRRAARLRRRGRARGGDGAVRRVRFRAPMTAAMLANRRATAPFGLHGGGDGKPGANRVERIDGA